MSTTKLENNDVRVPYAMTVHGEEEIDAVGCAGNGGIACTSNQDYADRLRLLRSWGRSSSLFVDSENIENRFNATVDNIPYDAKSVFEAIGYNLEGSELGAAFGLVQHRKLPGILGKRKAVAQAHINFFRRYEEWFELPRQNPGADTVWFAFPLIVREEAQYSDACRFHPQHHSTARFLQHTGTRGSGRLSKLRSHHAQGLLDCVPSRDDRRDAGSRTR